MKFRAFAFSSFLVACGGSSQMPDAELFPGQYGIGEAASPAPADFPGQYGLGEAASPAPADFPGQYGVSDAGISPAPDAD